MSKTKKDEAEAEAEVVKADIPRTTPDGFVATEKGGPYGGGTESPGSGARVQAVA